MADLKLQRFLIRRNKSTRETRVRGQILEQERNVLFAPVPSIEQTRPRRTGCTYCVMRRISTVLRSNSS